MGGLGMFDINFYKEKKYLLLDIQDLKDLGYVKF